jgi:hypothetical protein
MRRWFRFGCQRIAAPKRGALQMYRMLQIAVLAIILLWAVVAL